MRPVDSVPGNTTVSVYPVSNGYQPPPLPYNTIVYSTQTTNGYPQQGNVYPIANNYPPNYNNQQYNPNTMTNVTY